MKIPDTFFCPFCANCRASIKEPGALRERTTDVKIDIAHCSQCDTWFYLSQHKESQYVQGYHGECFHD